MDMLAKYCECIDSLSVFLRTSLHLSRSDGAATLVSARQIAGVLSAESAETCATRHVAPEQRTVMNMRLTWFGSSPVAFPDHLGCLMLQGAWDWSCLGFGTGTAWHCQCSWELAARSQVLDDTNVHPQWQLTGAIPRHNWKVGSTENVVCLIRNVR